MKEPFSQPIDRNESVCGALPAIPGGWMAEEMTLGTWTFHVTRPAGPDKFLDDAKVLAAHRRDDFMPYWPYLWPAARNMAEAVLAAQWPPDTEALEIGAGIGLVGLAALARGLRVTFSDYQQTAVDLAVHNARQNGFARANGLVLDWRVPLPKRFPIILGCDLLYEDRNHAPILTLLETMLGDGGLCWIGDPGRSQASRFCDSAAQRGFGVQLRDEQGQPRRNPVIGNFQLLCLSREDD